MSLKLPSKAKKYFWGDDLNSLSWEKHRQYIIKTLLEKADVDVLGWLFSKLSKEDLSRLLPKMKMSKKNKNFWRLYLS